MTVLRSGVVVRGVLGEGLSIVGSLQRICLDKGGVTRPDSVGWPKTDFKPRIFYGPQHPFEIIFCGIKRLDFKSWMIFVVKLTTQIVENLKIEFFTALMRIKK